MKKKKHKFIKERIFYTSLGVFVVLLSLVSVSYAFTDTSVISGTTNIETIPSVSFDKTEVFNIYNNTVKTLDIVLNTPRSTTCTYDILFYFYDSDKYIKRDDNKIDIIVYDNDNEVLNTTFDSQGINDYIKIGNYNITGNGSVTSNLKFDINYNGIYSYKGYITLDNVLCTNN